MPDDVHRVLELIRRHGWNATSFQVLEAGYRYWFAEDACVAYVDTGRTWVAAGAPIAATPRLTEVTDAFMAAGRAAGRRVVFFGVEERFVAAVRGTLAAFKIGEQPTWDPAHWEAGVRGSRSLREQLRRARAKGVRVRAVGAAELGPGMPLRAEVDRLVARWLASRPMAPMGFLVDVEPYRFADERRYFAAECDGRLVGFLAAVPIYGRRGWLVEDLLRAPEAPNGTNEVMIDAAMRAFATEGATFVTLGMVPLAGVERWLARARDVMRPLYDFRGLDAFKTKLRPSAREPIWLAHPPKMRQLAALRAVLTAFARGSLVRFGVATIARGGAHTLRLLAALLVPWACMLALAPERWFPSRAAQIAWVAFDAGLAVALWSLARRYRRGLGAAVAWAVSGDALLTLAQAILWNLPRMGAPSEALAIGVACLAPVGGAIIAWGALARHRTLAPAPAPQRGPGRSARA